MRILFCLSVQFFRAKLEKNQSFSLHARSWAQAANGTEVYPTKSSLADFINIEMSAAMLQTML